MYDDPISTLITRIKDRQKAIAEDALLTDPSPPCLYAFGKLAGQFQGLQLAIEIATATEDEHRERTDDDRVEIVTRV